MKYTELNDKAKERVLQWASEKGLTTDDDWYDHIYDDAKELGKLLGFFVKDIRFTGFWSQGDGASWCGLYRTDWMQLDKAKEYAPNDEYIGEIINELASLALVGRQMWDVRYSSYRYCHENTMDVDYVDNEADMEIAENVHDTVERVVKRFAKWIYWSLESQYEYLVSEEAIGEYLMGNDYEFDENGDVI